MVKILSDKVLLIFFCNICIVANLQATNKKICELETDSLYQQKSHKRISVENHAENFAKKSKLNTHYSFDTSNDHEDLSNEIAPTIGINDLPDPAIELVLIFGDRQTHLINRRFFKFGTGYDSTNLDSVKRTGWPTEFKWSNIIHHYSRYKINFHGNSFDKNSLLMFINKINQTPTFILSSMIYSIRASDSEYWDYLKFTNIRSFDLALNCNKCDDSFGSVLGNALALSHVDTLRIAKDLLGENNLLSALKSLRPAQLRSLNIEHNLYSWNVLIKICEQIVRLNVGELEISNIMIKGGSVNQLIEILAESNITKLITKNIKCESQEEVIKLFQIISTSKIRDLTLAEFDLKIVQNYEILFHNLKLRNLDLSYCNLKDFQLIHILKALPGKSLIKINLLGNNVSNEHLEQLGVLFSNTNIRSVNLTDNDIHVDYAKKYLVEPYPQIDWKIDCLYIDEPDQFGRMWIKKLNTTPEIKYLKTRESSI